MAKKPSNPQTEPAIYNIKAVVTQTGLNPATIRAWERRYGLPQPERTEGGHRQYSQHDIDILKWLISQQEEGMSISHAVELWQSLVAEGHDPLQTMAMSDSVAASSAVPAFGEQIGELRAAWIDACLQFDRKTAEMVLTHAFSIFPPEVVCIELLQKGLVEVGNGWHEGEVTVQQEHFTTTLSEQRLEILIAAVPPPTRTERIVISAAPGERHTFGDHVLTYLLRRQGWDVIYLGADVPVEDFGPTIDNLQPQLVIVSAQLFHTAAAVKDMAQSTDALLAYGGRIFNLIPKMREYIPGFFLGESYEEAVETAAKLLTSRPEEPEALAQDRVHLEAHKQYVERRSLIASHVWDTFIGSNRSTRHLEAINEDISLTISAALKLGDIDLLGTDISWVEELLLGYHLASDYIKEYMVAYYQAAEFHLGEKTMIVVDWLDKLVAGFASTR
jgi:methanogenic corrinoid protein MtbC1